MVEYTKQYQDKAVYLRDVIMWIEDSLTALNIWSSHAIPRGEEALINHEIIEDFRNDLNKLTGILVRNAIDDALSNTAKCETCGEPREWCIINTPYCEGNEKKEERIK